MEISCATDGADIRYTTDGTEPGENSAVYDSPIEVSGSMTIRAGAYKQDWADSEVAAGEYLILGKVAMPTFLPDPGTYSGEQKVEISCITPDVVIRYTTDGSDPTELSLGYAAPVSVSETTILRARAYQAEWGKESNISTAQYIIEPDKGDMNWDNKTDLADAILALQVAAGKTEPSRSVHIRADVNGDERIGTEEVVYILRKTGGLK